MKVDHLGEGLSVVINCEYKPSHNWMAFASWYSILKNLPDAKVCVVCKKGYSETQLFNWCYKFSVPFHFCTSFDKSENLIEISPDVMAVREFDPDLIGPSDAKNNDLTTFITYLNGCGKFVVAEWIDRIESPLNFPITKFHSEQMSVNEMRIFKLWGRMKTVFNSA